MKKQIIAIILEAAESTNIVPQVADVLNENINLGNDVVRKSTNEPVRNEHFYEKIIPAYTLDDFKNHFRMSRSQVEVKFKIKYVE